MKYFIIFALICCLVLNVDAFGLRKGQADDNDSHAERETQKEKVVSEETNDKPVAKQSRKHYRDSSGDDNSQSSNEAESLKPQKSLAIGVNVGGSPDGKKNEGVEKLIQMVKEVMKRVNTEPLFRSKKFEFEDSNQQRSQSSVGVELDTPTVLNWVNKVLSSRKFKKATDEFARKAAVIFRALKEN